MIDLGTAPLAAASQTGLGLQNVEAEKERTQAQAAEAGQKPFQEMAVASYEKNLNMVTVTSQMAEGFKRASGDNSLDRLVGMQIDGRLLYPMILNHVKQHNINHLFQAEDGLYEIDSNTGQTRKINDFGKSNRPKTVKLFQKGKWVENSLSYDDQGKPSVVPLDEGATPEQVHARAGGGGSSTKDLQAQKALLNERKVHENRIAATLDDDQRKADRQWLIDHKDEIDQAEKALAKIAGAKPTNSKTDGTIPLNNKLPGLD